MDGRPQRRVDCTSNRHRHGCRRRPWTGAQCRESFASQTASTRMSRVDRGTDFRYLGAVSSPLVTTMKEERTIVDPRVQLRNAGAADPLWDFADAFDAVTNGMSNPDAFDRLEGCSDPAIRPWKALANAVGAIYAGDGPACRAAIEKLDGPPEVLKPLFEAWLDPSDQVDYFKDSDAGVARLWGELFSGPHPLVLLAEQAEEALRQGMVEHFEALSIRVLKQLAEMERLEAKELAIRYAVRCVGLLAEEGWEGTDFFSSTIHALGHGDGMTALAFASIEHDDEAAASALEAALTAREGSFLSTAGLERVAREALDILRNGPATDRDVQDSRPGVARSSEEGVPMESREEQRQYPVAPLRQAMAKRFCEDPGQLELFPEAANDR